MKYAVAKQMKKQATDGFGEVKNHLESLIDAVLNKVSEATTMHKVGSINIGTRILNMKISLHVVDTNSEDLNASLQQL